MMQLLTQADGESVAYAGDLKAPQLYDFLIQYSSAPLEASEDPSPKADGDDSKVSGCVRSLPQCSDSE